jgi:uncharacterized protein YutE (UPF0331/DUF86 family)
MEIYNFNQNIEGIKQYLKFLDDVDGVSTISDLKKNMEKYLSISMALFTMLNHAIEIGEDLIDKYELKIATKYREIFEELEEKNIITSKTAQFLIKHMHTRIGQF